MAKRIGPDCTKTYLFPPSLEDFVPPFYPVRFIRAFVEKPGLKALGFAEEDGEIGRPRYSVDLLWKVILYGYDPKIRSYRELERMGMAHLGTMWLNGIVERAGVLKEKALSRKKEEVEQKVAAAKEKIALSDEAGTGHVSFVDEDARMMKIRGRNGTMTK